MNYQDDKPTQEMLEAFSEIEKRKKILNNTRGIFQQKKWQRIFLDDNGSCYLYLARTGIHSDFFGRELVKIIQNASGKEKKEVVAMLKAVHKLIIYVDNNFVRLQGRRTIKI